MRAAAGDCHDFTLAIPNEAFISGRVRYQDAPDICFLKLQRELLACSSGLPALHMRVSDAELEAYRVAHAPRAPRTRPRPPGA